MRDLVQKNSLTSVFFWLSLACHSLFLVLIYGVNHQRIMIQDEKKYYYYVPAYTVSAKALTSHVMEKPQKALRDEVLENPLPALDNNFDLSQIQIKSFKSKHVNDAQSVSTMSLSSNANEKYEEAIHLIGDTFLDDPLRKLLGRAITRHLYYPEIAREMNLRGMVGIKFLLNPDGSITDAHIVKSSRESILDKAAFNAILSSSPIVGVDLYVKQPKYLIVNIIF